MKPKVSKIIINTLRITQMKEGNVIQVKSFEFAVRAVNLYK